jgi:hypothetical protein
VYAGGSTIAYLVTIIAGAAMHDVPTIYRNRHYVAAGGLVSYGADGRESYRGAATYVDRILRGEKPADLAVQRPTKYQLVINLKTAKALGLTIPETLLATARRKRRQRICSAYSHRVTFRLYQSATQSVPSPWKNLLGYRTPAHSEWFASDRRRIQDHEIDILVDDQRLCQALGIVCDRAYGPGFRERLKCRRSGGGWSFLVGIRCPSGLSM